MNRARLKLSSDFLSTLKDNPTAHLSEQVRRAVFKGASPMKARVVGLFILMAAFLLISNFAFAYTDQELADAIFKAEGGYKAKYLYGIRSVKYRDEQEARQICLNTIRNNRIRFRQQNKYDDYLEFLASRYAPLNADNDKKGLNKNWIRNVKYFLNQKET